MIEQMEAYVKAKREEQLHELQEFLKQPSISASPDHKKEMVACAKHVMALLKNSGVENVALIETKGNPVVYGDWLHAQGKPTVLIYGHYDVQPVDPLELWVTPPFEPDIREGKLYARGASDNKGQMFLHIKAVEAYLKTKGSLPVNIKFCIEGEEEIGSPHLPLLLEKKREKFTSDLIVISDTAMLGENKPAICYGLRGLITFELKVTGANKDLPSGLYGGAVPNPIHAMAKILGSMHTEDGKVAIEGFYDDVQESREEEKAAILSLQHDDLQLCSKLGISELCGEKGYTTLERMWTRPTLEINGIHSGYSKAGFKTIIPSGECKFFCVNGFFTGGWLRGRLYMEGRA